MLEKHATTYVNVEMYGDEMEKARSVYVLLTLLVTELYGITPQNSLEISIIHLPSLSYFNQLIVLNKSVNLKQKYTPL